MMDTVYRSAVVCPTPDPGSQRAIVASLLDRGFVKFILDDLDPELAGLRSGKSLIDASRSLFETPEIANYILPIPDDAADVGYYRFAVNNVAGGVRQYQPGMHSGLPYSEIWNHRAVTNPRFAAIGAEQEIFRSVVDAYCDLIRAIVDALDMVDPEGVIRSMVGANGKTDGSFLRIISSAGAEGDSPVTLNNRGLVTRHRAHVDTAVFVVQPPILHDSAVGGRLMYLDKNRNWARLEVQPGELVVFTGRDFNTVMAPHASHKFLHEVVATPRQSRKKRLSAFFRVGVDPNATNLHTVAHQPFRTLNGRTVRTGGEYYRAMSDFRATA